MVVDWLDDPILCQQIAEAPITHKGRLDQVTQRIQDLVKCPYKLIWVIGEDVLTLTPEDKAIAAALKVNLREPFEKEILRQKLLPGMVAFDAGACVGTYAIDMARMVGSTGRVIAVEPDYLNYLCLLVNLRINGCHWVEAHNVALGETSEDCFIHNDDGNIGNTVINKAGVGKAIRTTIPKTFSSTFLTITRASPSRKTAISRTLWICFANRWHSIYSESIAGGERLQSRMGFEGVLVFHVFIHGLYSQFHLLLNLNYLSLSLC